MNRIALDLGFIQIYWYSIFIFLGMSVACFVIFKEAKRRGVEEEFLLNLTFNTIIFGIIGARLYYVLFNLPYYLAKPIEILEIWNGGLAIHGGLFLGFVVATIYCKKHRVNIMKMLDIVVVGIIIGQAIGRWGNFFNSEAYGAITTYETLKAQGIPAFIIKGMYIMGQYRQPTFFYESVGCTFGFLAMLIVRCNKYLKRGSLTGFYLVWYGTLRLLIEPLRADSLMFHNVKIAMIVSIIFILIGLMIFVINSVSKKGKAGLYRTDPKEIENEQFEKIVYYK